MKMSKKFQKSADFLEFCRQCPRIFCPLLGTVRYWELLLNKNGREAEFCPLLGAFPLLGSAPLRALSIFQYIVPPLLATSPDHSCLSYIRRCCQKCKIATAKYSHGCEILSCCGGHWQESNDISVMIIAHDLTDRPPLSCTFKCLFLCCHLN